MMINKRLIGAVPDSKKYIARTVAFQWLGMAANMVMVFAIAALLSSLLVGTAAPLSLALTVALGLGALLVRVWASLAAGKASFLASRSVKGALRRAIYQKLLRLGPDYSVKASTAQVVQVASEGVEQLETYFGAYLPQFFFSLLAPLTLFAVLAPISLKVAFTLLVCVPLIPIAIAAVQTFAKKLLSRYWGQYTALGDSFLENLQGLTTLKIYQADGRKHEEMNKEAEHFRKITMKVLTMQLNSITIMDLVAYGGAVLGLILAVLEFKAGAISFGGCLTILLLSADFFLPMRQLGSFFHVAMNGMAASDKIFALLDLPEDAPRTKAPPTKYNLRCKGVGYSYVAGRPVLQGINLDISEGSFTAIVGESGSGKSTLAALLTGRRRGYTGSATLGGVELEELDADCLSRAITYVGFASYLFGGTVAENLRMASPDATDDQLWAVLDRVHLSGFLRANGGLTTPVTAQGGNLSGGQRQRLALARALLHDTPIYIFDEASSNIDVESENAILEEIHALAETRTVLMISHRLANVAGAGRIYVLEHGVLDSAGTHEELMARGALYHKLWDSQQELENKLDEEVAS